MREGLRPGDRVRVYLGPTRRPITGTVEHIHEKHGGIYIIEDGFNSVHNECPFDAKWCRRLRARKRRRVWIPKEALAEAAKKGSNKLMRDENGMSWIIRVKSPSELGLNQDNWVEFIEAKRGAK